MMWKKAIAAGLIEGFQFGINGEHRRHLQYANGIILFSATKEENIFNLKLLIKLLEATIGLKVNFTRSNLAGMFVLEGKRKFTTEVMGAQLTTFPINYMGLALHAGNIRRVHGFQSRLEEWKGRLLSAGGR